MKPSAARVLSRLRAADGAFVRGLDLASPDVGGLRFGGRLHELALLGYRIEKRRDPKSAVWQYRLIEKPEQLRLEIAS
jgi:hypothetical protein